MTVVQGHGAPVSVTFDEERAPVVPPVVTSVSTVGDVSAAKGVVEAAVAAAHTAMEDPVTRVPYASSEMMQATGVPFAIEVAAGTAPRTVIVGG